MVGEHPPIALQRSAHSIEAKRQVRAPDQRRFGRYSNIRIPVIYNHRLMAQRAEGRRE